MTTTASRRRKSPARHAIELLTTTPWAITPEAFENILAIASRTNASPAAIAAELGKPLEYTRTVTTRQGVATIPVEGPLFRHADLFSEISGATSYERIGLDFATALESPDVRAILFAIDSPGGEVNAVEELAQMIFAARGRKPIVAHVSGAGCSAAYWIAAAAEEVVAGSTAVLGSIGALMRFVDFSEAEARAGIKRIVLVSSQSPDKAVDPRDADGRAKIQAIVDGIAAVFVDRVATYRGVTTQTVLADFGRGHVMLGAEAVAVGLADRVDTFEAVHAALVARVNARAQSPLVAQSNTSPLRTVMPQKPSTSAASPLFPEGASVRATVERIGVAPGDEGSIAAVSDETAYLVEFESGSAWLAESELEPAEDEQDPPADAPPPDGDQPEAGQPKLRIERSARSLTAKQLQLRYPAAVKAIRTAAATAERKRIADIDALAAGSGGSAEGLALIGAAKADPARTAESVAVELLKLKPKAGTAPLDKLRADEAANNAPAPVAGGAEETVEQHARRVAALASRAVPKVS